MGSIVMSNFGSVNFTGLEPITNTGSSSDIVFNLPTGATNVAKLGDDTSGGNNIALGTSALLSNTNRDNLIAIGGDALFSNGIGVLNAFEATANIAIGTLAMRNNTRGYQNLAVGYGASFTNQTGGYNTAIGNEALWTNTNGFNTAIGWRALYSNTIANENTAVGYRAMVSTTEGYGNVAMGYDALLNNTLGYQNIAIGQNANTINTIGNQNISIGASAGVLTNNLTNAIAIGTNAVSSQSNTFILGGNNKVSIGGISSPSSYLTVTAADNTNPLATLTQTGSQPALSVIANNSTSAVKINNPSSGLGIELNNAAITVSGAGRMAFQVTATGINSITIPNSTFANNVNDILIVTHKGVAANVNTAVYVQFSAGNWKIFSESGGNIAAGEVFNVLVFKQ